MSTESARPGHDLILYTRPWCLYCSYVRRAIAKLGLDVEERDIRADPGHRHDLVAATGRQTVPVLRIRGEGGEGGDSWMPESRDIVRYLQDRFG